MLRVLHAPIVHGLVAGVSVVAALAALRAAYVRRREQRELAAVQAAADKKRGTGEVFDLTARSYKPVPDSGLAKWRDAVKMIRAHVAKKHPQGLDCELVMLGDVRIEAVFLFEVAHLSAYAPKAGRRNKMDLGTGAVGYQREYNQLLGAQDAILQDIVRSAAGDTISTAFLRAGPRSELHFEPSGVRAAIVTCGGLCPGLNNIIQGIVRTLLSLYGAAQVLGVRGGYQGFDEASEYTPIDLSLHLVEGIQKVRALPPSREPRRGRAPRAAPSTCAAPARARPYRAADRARRAVRPARRWAGRFSAPVVVRSTCRRRSPS